MKYLAIVNQLFTPTLTLRQIYIEKNNNKRIRHYCKREKEGNDQRKARSPVIVTEY